MLWFLLFALVSLFALLARELWRAASRARRARRAASAPARLAEQARSLTELTAGGSPERALDIATPAVVEAHALGHPCQVCGAAVRLVDHSVLVMDGARLRRAETRCPTCGHERSWYFRLLPPN